MTLLDRVRTKAHQGLTTKLGDGLAPVRLSKELLRRTNLVLGKPLCSEEELAARRAAADKLEALRRARAAGQAPVATKARVQAPVTIYFEKDRNVRELRRIEELLAAKGIDARRLDVSEDRTTLDFVLRTARIEADRLPVVFVADRAIGNIQALVDADVSGRLEREVFP